MTVGLPSWFNLDTSHHRHEDETLHKLKSGMYTVVRSLLRMLARGKEGKTTLDLVVNACSHMQNLREGILTYRDRMSGEHNERKRSDLLKLCLVRMIAVA